MKNRTQKLLALLVLLSAINHQLSTANAQATAFTYQGRVTDNGTNFNGPGQFEFALVTSTNTSSTATATASLSGQFVTSYNVTFAGNGYVTAPAVTISGGGGSGATAHAVISGGTVTSVVADSAGSGYTSAPTVTIASPPANYAYTTWWSNDGTSVNGSEPSAVVSVAVNGGLFTEVLGDTTQSNMMAIPATLFNQPNLQLRIWFNDGVNGFAVLNPVQNLTPAPYATFANTASNVLGIVSSANLPDGLGGFEGTVSGGGVVGGGDFNTASGMLTTIGGGNHNMASNSWSVVSGGAQNVAGGQGATVGGGLFDIASGSSATVGGGNENTASGNYATVGGGTGNLASGQGSTVSGGGYDGTTFSGNQSIGNASAIGGGLDNIISNNGPYAFIGGGIFNTNSGYAATIGGGYQNTASEAASTVGGGSQNIASNDFATVSGGGNNTAGGRGSFIGGGCSDGVVGSGNQAMGDFSVIVGGLNNNIPSTGLYAVIGGGEFNEASGTNSTVAGGFSGIARGTYSTVMGGTGGYAGGYAATSAGGSANIALGDYSFAAGDTAYAANNGTFVWADASSTGNSYSSTGNNQFLIRSVGGVGINTASPGSDLLEVRTQNSNGNEIRFGYYTGGAGNLIAGPSYVGIATDDLTTRLAIVQSGGASAGNVGIGTTTPSQKLQVIGNILASGTITGSSDRNVKEHFEPVNSVEILDKVASLPITRWDYKADSTVRHLGPMAQDFYAAFNIGMDDKHISMVDADGVALAAIQGLNQKLDEKDEEIADLKARLDALEKIVLKQNAN